MLRAKEWSHDLADRIEAVRCFLAGEDWDRAAEEGETIVVFLGKHGQVAALAAFAEEMRARLPEVHSRWPVFCEAAGTALLALGEGSAALERFRRVMVYHRGGVVRGGALPGMGRMAN